MMSIITGKSPHQEASAKEQTFNLTKWIRARRLQWLGHILRMDSTTRQNARLLKLAVFEMHKAPQAGDLLMDAPRTSSWRELLQFASDRELWRTRVRAMRQQRLRVEMGSHVEEEQTVSFTINP